MSADAYVDIEEQVRVALADLLQAAIDSLTASLNGPEELPVAGPVKGRDEYAHDHVTDRIPRRRGRPRAISSSMRRRQR